MGAWGANAREGRFRGRTEVVQNLVELVDIVAALEEGFAAEELSENAADRPDIDLGELLVLNIECVSSIDPRTY